MMEVWLACLVAFCIWLKVSGVRCFCRRAWSTKSLKPLAPLLRTARWQVPLIAVFPVYAFVQVWSWWQLLNWLMYAVCLAVLTGFSWGMMKWHRRFWRPLTLCSAFALFSLPLQCVTVQNAGNYQGQVAKKQVELLIRDLDEIHAKTGSYPFKLSQPVMYKAGIAWKLGTRCSTLAATMGSLIN